MMKTNLRNLTTTKMKQSRNGLRPRRPAHDRLLVFNMSIFNARRDGERAFDAPRWRENVWN